MLPLVQLGASYTRDSQTEEGNCILSIHLLPIISVVIISIQIDEIGNWFCRLKLLKRNEKSRASEYNTSAREAACCSWELPKMKKHQRRESQNRWWDEWGLSSQLFRLKSVGQGKPKKKQQPTKVNKRKLQKENNNKYETHYHRENKWRIT